MEEKIIEYMNSCTKCFAAFEGKSHFPVIIPVREFKVQRNDILIRTEHTEWGEQIAITMWNGIKGYQLKGNRISLMQQEWEELEKEMRLRYQIQEVYCVTPGKHAGEKVNWNF